MSPSVRVGNCEIRFEDDMTAVLVTADGSGHALLLDKRGLAALHQWAIDVALHCARAGA